jgi:NAD(P)-dependent dehydrogenase (short-subunit alcohol dehydrogenase family)
MDGQTQKATHGRLTGKRAVVTGSAMGLGAAIARRFALEGAEVACVDINAVSNAELVRSIERDGGRAVSIIGDVSIADQVEQIGKACDRCLGGVDILVNNAGIIPARNTALDSTEEDWDRCLRVNLKSVFLMSRMAVPRLISAGGGSIVNLSSITGLVGLPIRPAYSASKGAIASLTRQMAVDFGPQNVRVNALCPSFVITDLNREMFDRMKEEKLPWERMIARHPLRRLGEPEDVAYAALYLASDESRWVTGISLPVDGGYTAE